MRNGTLAFALTGCLVLASEMIPAQTVPDATGVGPYATTSSEYKLPAFIDPDVATELPTELWARVYRPVDLSNAPYPLLAFLHGNHATCGRFEGIGPGRFDINVQYTFTGTCPSGYVVVPSHEGYAYLADRLASWGYIVVSINANRGVNAAPGVEGDVGLNLRRGRLILKHLQQLSEWNAAGGAPESLGFDVQGTLDFDHLGLLGHSRGGEGVRAAYNLYNDQGSPWPARIGPVGFEGIFEIGPVDGQTAHILNAAGTPWNVLLPMRDGDVFNLQGVRPFDRMLLNPTPEVPATPKSTFTVWGTNHNFYNTEWQLSDSPGCLGHTRLFPNLLGSADQRSTALASALAFFRAHVGPAADPAFALLFNPQIPLPADLEDVTRIDRGYADAAGTTLSRRFDDFDQPAGFNSPGVPNSASNVTVNHGRIPNHSSQQRVAQIAWKASGTETWFQSNWTLPGFGVDVSDLKTLDFRVARQCGNDECTTTDSHWRFATSFSVRLVGADGTLSTAIPISSYLTLTGPVGGLVFGFGTAPHPILQTIRIPLQAFGNAAILDDLRGVRFTFDDTKSDEIFIGNIRLSSVSALNATTFFPAATLAGDDSPIDDGPGKSDVNQVKAVRQVSENNGASLFEIELTSNREFLPKGELLVLGIGDQQFTMSRYRETGDTNTVIFTLTSEQFAQLVDGAPVTVQYGTDGNRPAWKFGKFDKTGVSK
jgi:hypothetical protein